MEAMLFQVAERSLRFCRLFETKNVNGKIRFFRVRPGRNTFNRVMEAKSLRLSLKIPLFLTD